MNGEEADLEETGHDAKSVGYLSLSFCPHKRKTVLDTFNMTHKVLLETQVDRGIVQ